MPPKQPTPMGAAEIAAAYGCSRQYVHKLHTTDPDFPTPITRLTLGYVWDSEKIAAYFATHPLSDRRRSTASDQDSGAARD